MLAALGTVLFVGLQAAPASAASSAHGWIRFAHFAPDNGPVRVTLDGTTLESRATFENVTAYRSVAVGTHTVTLTDIDAPHTRLTDKVTVANGGADTVGAIESGKSIKLKTFADDLAPGPNGDARVRVVNTAPSVTSVKVTLKRNSGIAETAFRPGAAALPRSVSLSSSIVPYGAAGSYMNVAAGTYTVVVDDAGHTIITGKDWPVTADTVASLVIVQSKSKPTLEVLRDAAGSPAPPTGGMETGYGGAAHLLAAPGHRSSDSEAAELAGLVALIGVLGALGWGSTRRPDGRRRITTLTARSGRA